MAREFSSLDQLINIVNNYQQHLPDRAMNVADICRINKNLLEQKVHDLEQILSSANPEWCSALFVASLKAMWDVSTAKKQDSGLDKATDLFKTLLDSGVCVRRHVRLVPDIYLPLARECVFHCLVKKNNPFLAYDLGKTAVETFMVEGENCLTSLHAATLAAAIKIGDFEEARKYVYTPILDIVSELNPSQEHFDVTSKRSRLSAPPFFDSKYVLSYLFYCGLVVAKEGNYRQALQFVEMCICVPGSVASQVQVDALKKFYILSLIVHGKVDLPANRCPTLMRILKAKGRLDAYVALVDAVVFAGDKTKAVTNVLEAKKLHFEQDNNWGLCHILVKTTRRKAVLNVAKVYSSVKLENLARRAYCKQEELISSLKDLEAQGELIADIDYSTNTVRLSVTRNIVTNEDIRVKTEQLDFLRKQVDRLDVAAQKNPSHIVRTLRGVMAHLALMDDEGLSEAAFPMDT